MNSTSDADTLELSRACAALWTATLSLMTAFMHTPAPAHRLLLARRVARNLATLREQECFTPSCRQTFGRLSRRWNDKADRLDPRREQRASGIGALQANWFNR